MSHHKKTNKHPQEKKPITKMIFSKDHLRRDVAVIVGLILVFTVLVMGKKYLELSVDQVPLENVAVTMPSVKKEPIEPEIRPVDTTDWAPYVNQWYGFSLKYPKNWLKPTYQKSIKVSDWEYRYQFRKPSTEASDPYMGFDVVIYNVEKIKQVTQTDEFPTLKNPEFTMDECSLIEGNLVENVNFPMEEILFEPNEKCFKPAFFFSLTRDRYIYNVSVIQKDGSVATDFKDIEKNIPEFMSFAASFDLIDIVRPKPQVVKKVSAPMPVWYKKEGGRLVCAKKNDHPGMSQKGKKKHLDMECCLDPDEYPNPNCYYPPSKYGKYLP